MGAQPAAHSTVCAVQAHTYRGGPIGLTHSQITSNMLQNMYVFEALYYFRVFKKKYAQKGWDVRKSQESFYVGYPVVVGNFVRCPFVYTREDIAPPLFFSFPSFVQ